MKDTTKLFICLSPQVTFKLLELVIKTMPLKINPLDIPEIIRMVGRCVDEASQIATMQVSGLFHKNVAASAWETVMIDIEERVLYKGSLLEADRFLPWESLDSYGHHVRNVSMVSDTSVTFPDTYYRPSITDFWTTLRDLPHLNSVRLNFRDFESSSLPYLRHHFPKLTVISVLHSPPGFWGEVLSSCPALVIADGVKFSLTDLTEGPEWVSTRLVKLDVHIYMNRDVLMKRKLLQDNLFRRIAKLVKLDRLKVKDVGWSYDYEGQPLNAQNWEALSKIKTLTYLELGPGSFGKLDDGIVAGLSKLRGLKRFRAEMPRRDTYHKVRLSDVEQTLLAQIRDLGVSFDYR